MVLCDFGAQDTKYRRKSYSFVKNRRKTGNLSLNQKSDAASQNKQIQQFRKLALRPVHKKTAGNNLRFEHFTSEQTSLNFPGEANRNVCSGIKALDALIGFGIQFAIAAVILKVH